MSKITLNQVADLTQTTTAAATINANSTTVQTAFDNTLSRDGTAPNQMLNALDMNSNQIINLPTPATANSALRLQDLSTFTGGGTITNIPAGGTTGQSIIKNSNTNYDISFGNPLASAINFTQAGTGAVTRTVSSKLQDVVSIDDFGAAGDGVTNDSGAFATAAAALNGSGEIRLGRKSYLIDTALTLPPGVVIVGPYGRVAGTPGWNFSINWPLMTSRLYINSAVSIKLQAAAGITNCAIFRKGITLPAADSSLFAGTAIVFQSNNDNQVIKDCFIGGFAVGIKTNDNTGSNQVSRYWIERCYMDNLTNIYADTSFDSCRIKDIQGWPFLTIEAYANSGSTNSALIRRSGTGITVVNAADDLEIDGVLMYGYNTNFNFNNTGSVNIGRIWSDGPVNQVGTRGVDFAGNTTGITIDSLWAWTTENGVVCEVSGGTAHIKIGTLHTQGNSAACVSLSGGTLIVGNWYANNAPVALSVTTGGRITVSNAYFDASISNAQPITVGPSVDMRNINITHLNWDAAAGNVLHGANNPLLPTIASAATLPIPVYGDFFVVSGTTNITAMTGSWAGRRIVLYFLGALTVTNGGGGGILLAGNLVTTAGTTLTLLALTNGGSWVELSRSVK